MNESILSFSEQLNFEPDLNSEKVFENKSKFIVGGMGGSHLGAGILRMIYPQIDLLIHRDYGLPQISEADKDKTLFIASSYSGNTEEVLDFADEAYSRGFDLVIVTTGGKLLAFAKDNNIPFIALPELSLQPRYATALSAVALCHIILPREVNNLKEALRKVDPKAHEESAASLSSHLINKIPVIYTSSKLRALAYNWKIKLNETAKIPAFYNSFPELNHNEMQGFGYGDKFQLESNPFHFIFISDPDDDARIQNRMKITENLYREKGFSVTLLKLEGQTLAEKIFNSILLCDWLSLHLSKKYEHDPVSVPLIEEFKKQL